MAVGEHRLNDIFGEFTRLDTEALSHETFDDVLLLKRVGRYRELIEQCKAIVADTKEHPLARRHALHMVKMIEDSMATQAAASACMSEDQKPS